MNKIAIIIDGDLINRKGQVNASLSRIKHLQAIANYQIDVYSIQKENSLFVRILSNRTKQKRHSFMTVDNINIKFLWRKFSLFNYVLTYKLKYKPLFVKQWYSKTAKLFRDYDIISAHSLECGLLALTINNMYGIPFYVTWHGSDIHTNPYISKYTKRDTISVLEKAKSNFFVSKALMDLSMKLTNNATKQILYNGVSSLFYRYSDKERIQLRTSYNVTNRKVVAFIGNLFPVKNVLILPKIFRMVLDNYQKEVAFWIIGDGKLRYSLIQQLKEYDIECQLWGNQPVERIPDFMNSIDVLVLPSINEGLPLVTVEAIKCGANVVGSDVGGIAEVIGSDNVFALNNDFAENISQRIVEMLSYPIPQSLGDIFDWNATAKQENRIYQNTLNI